MKAENERMNENDEERDREGSDSGVVEDAKNWSLGDRTRDFAIRVIRLYSALPKKMEAQVIGKQLLRSGTSVGAHYREALRARSDAEFISKLEVGLQELDETRYWLELLREAEIVAWSRLSLLDQEADELTTILVTIVKNRKASRQ